MRKLALLALAASSCALHAPAPRPQPWEGEWGKQLDQWLRSAELYDRLDSRATAHAVYASPRVREARALRIADWRAMTAAERDALVAQERADGERYEDFLLAFWTSEPRQNDLANASSAWRVALAVGGQGEALPVKVTSLDKTDPQLRELYPFISDFDSVYLVRFPRFTEGGPLEAQSFTLRIAGAVGELELKWEAGEKPPQPPMPLRPLGSQR